MDGQQMLLQQELTEQVELQIPLPGLPVPEPSLPFPPAALREPQVPFQVHAFCGAHVSGGSSLRVLRVLLALLVPPALLGVLLLVRCVVLVARAGCRE